MRILIVEDEKAFLLVFRDLLENEGFEILAAEDGKKAWAMLCDEKVDLVLLDLILPEVTGMEILRRMRKGKTTKEIPVIVMSALDDQLVIKNCRELSVNHYFVKGAISLSELTDTIHSITRAQPYGTPST